MRGSDGKGGILRAARRTATAASRLPPARRGDARVQLLLQVLDEAFTAKGWQGATLSGAVRGLTAKQALWRPGGRRSRGASEGAGIVRAAQQKPTAAGQLPPARHNIWELVLHTAYWKHVVRERVAGGARTPFPRPPRNFPSLPPHPNAAAWKADVALLKREHEHLRRTVARLAPARLDAPVSRSPWVVAEQVFGIAAHDLYHTGQIQLLKAMQRR
jgi:hypothetical protein